MMVLPSVLEKLLDAEDAAVKGGNADMGGCSADIINGGRS